MNVTRVRGAPENETRGRDGRAPRNAVGDPMDDPSQFF